MRLKTIILVSVLILIISVPTNVQADTHYYTQESNHYSYATLLGNNTVRNHSIMASPDLDILSELQETMYEYEWYLELVAIEFINVHISIEPNNLTTLLTITRDHSLCYSVSCQDDFQTDLELLEIVYHGNEQSYSTLNSEFNITITSESDIEHTVRIDIVVFWTETYYGEFMGYVRNIDYTEPGLQELDPITIATFVIMLSIVLVALLYKKIKERNTIKNKEKEVSQDE